MVSSFSSVSIWRFVSLWTTSQLFLMSVLLWNFHMLLYHLYMLFLPTWRSNTTQMFYICICSRMLHSYIGMKDHIVDMAADSPHTILSNWPWKHSSIQSTFILLESLLFFVLQKDWQVCIFFIVFLYILTRKHSLKFHSQMSISCNVCLIKCKIHQFLLRVI